MSLETSGSYENTLAFAVRPLVFKRASQCDPRRPAGAAPAEIRQPAALGCGGERWGKPRGSPRACFGGSEGALGGSAAELGGARRWPLRRRESPVRWRSIRAAHGRGGFHGVPGRWGGSWTATEGKGRARSPSSPHGGRRRSNGGLVGVLAREEGNGEAL
jgi:hypothetical protein